MTNLLMSSYSLQELTTVISETVKIEFERQNSLSTPQPDNAYLTRKETARILGVSLPTLNDWSKKGLLPSYRISSRIRYKKEEVLNSLNKRNFKGGV